MKKLFSIAFILILGSLGLQAQQKITVKMPIEDTSKYVQLAYYYGNKQFIRVDSAKVDKDGLLHFENEKGDWKGGVYLVVISPSKFYDLAYSGTENDIYMEFDTTDYVRSVKFKNSPENQYLFSFRKYLASKSDEASSLQDKLKGETNPEKANELRSTLQNLQKEVNKEIRKRAEAEKGLFASQVMSANLEPEIPSEIPTLANGRPDSTYAYRVYKSKFFENINFNDDRLIRTPFLESKLERYFTNLVYPKADSIKKETDFVLQKAKGNKDVFKYVLWYLTNKYETTDMVGLDGVVVHLYENYYLKEADWLDADQKKRFEDRLKTIKPLETGKVMPTLLLKDLNGTELNLNNVKAKYTIVYFYSPDCGHCKDHAPILASFFNENKDKGFAVWNISTERKQDLNEIKDFVKTYGTQDLTNLYDPERRYDFLNNFDVYSTPTLYILDEGKHIIGKRIPIEEITKFIEYYEGNK